jgi:hypothetical protein
MRMPTRCTIWLLVCLAPLAACGWAQRTLQGKSIDGHVLDAQTGQPIPGAHVMYLWEAGINPSTFTAHNASEICYHAAGAVTDAQGHFRIDPWEEPRRYDVHEREPGAWAYAPGYVPAEFGHSEGREREPTVHPNDIIRLQPSRATGDERLGELWNVIRRGCMHGGLSQRNQYPLLKAAYDEGKSAAMTERQMELLRHFARLVARAQVAADPLSDGGVTDAQIERYVRENLQ